MGRGLKLARTGADQLFSTLSTTNCLPTWSEVNRMALMAPGGVLALITAVSSMPVL